MIFIVGGGLGMNAFMHANTSAHLPMPTCPCILLFWTSLTAIIVNRCYYSDRVAVTV